MADIEAEILANPTHPMIRGLKGAHKARIQGMGKRGGGRVVYYVATWERDDLSSEQRCRILTALESIKRLGS